MNDVASVESDEQLAVELVGVGKRFWKLNEHPTLLRSLVPFRHQDRSELWALRGVDLQVRPGETVGVLGRNGSGKTTLLQVLSGVTQPTEGRVRIVGRIAPLISVGVGFHPEMSGRDNVRMNGLLLGMSNDDLRDRFDDIVAFAELADFIDTPVKYYSSGMFVRLGFSVAVHADPQVLLVDEVLAVGDLAFQLKCVKRMQELQQTGTTIVVVSHSLSAVRDLCPRSIVMRSGNVAFDGETEAALGHYLDILTHEGLDDADEGFRTAADRRMVGGVTVLSAELCDDSGPVTYVEARQPLEYRTRVRFDRAVTDPLFGINVLGDDHRAAYGVHTPVSAAHRTFAAGEEAEVVVRMVNHLGGGTYRITFVVASSDSVDVYGGDQRGLLFFVPPVPNSYGSAALDGVISIDGIGLAGTPDRIGGERAG